MAGTGGKGLFTCRSKSTWNLGWFAFAFFLFRAVIICFNPLDSAVADVTLEILHVERIDNFVRH